MNSVKVTEAFFPTIFFFWFLSVIVVSLHPPGAKGIVLSRNSRNHRQTERTENNLARKFCCETLRHFERCKSFEMHIISKLTAKDSMRYNCNEFCCSRHSRQFLDNNLGKHVRISWRHKVNYRQKKKTEEGIEVSDFTSEIISTSSAITTTTMQRFIIMQISHISAEIRSTSKTSCDLQTKLPKPVFTYVVVQCLNTL